MISKRDLQLIRLACRRRWLTPEQGEECLVLKRQLGDKWTLEQIFRQRRYLDDAEIAELVAQVGQATRRRPSQMAPGPRSAPATEKPASPSAVEPSPASESPSGPVPANTPPEGSLTQWNDAVGPSMTVDGLEFPPSGDEDPTLFAVQAESGSGPQTVESPPLPMAADETPRVPQPVGTDQPGEATVIASVPAVVRGGDEETILELPVSSILGPVSAPSSRAADPDKAPTVERGPSIPEIRAAALANEVGRLTGIYAAYGGASSPVEAVPGPRPTAETPPFDPDTEEAQGVFGAYTVHDLVARGDRSAVFRATHNPSRRDVALKILKVTGRAAALFVSERADDLVAAAKLDDPRVVRVLDVGYVEDRYYVALEHVSGWSLDDRLATGDLDLTDALRIGADIAAALRAAEAHGVVHGDVRPDHVLVDDDGRARLTGFGFYQVYQGRRGSPGFMAPEVAGGGPATLASDQFGLGATLFWLTTGRPAFNAVNDAERFRLSQHTEPPDPRLFRPALPAEIARLILRLMARAPAERFERTALAHAAVEAIRDAMRAPARRLAPVALRPLVARASVGAMLLVLTALAIPLVLDLLGWASLRDGVLARPVALASAAALWFAAATQIIVALIRRGEIPLPRSSGRLVQMQELSGLAGATLLVAGFAVAPPALVNLGLAVGGVLLLGSGMFGALLRGAVAAARGDGGVGRVLTVLGDVRLMRWRRLHVPGLTTIAAVALVRWMALAYFASS